jgi:hypothetical protein
MKKIVLLILIASFCHRSSYESNNLKVQISNIEKVSELSGEIKGGEFYSIYINLVNNTDSIISFWTMSCSWESNWVFDSNALKFYVECPKNYPIIQQINSNDMICYKGTIEILDTTSYDRLKKLKIGFVFVRPNEVKSETDFIKILRNKINSKRDIIWSNSFKIN